MEISPSLQERKLSPLPLPKGTISRYGEDVMQSTRQLDFSYINIDDDGIFEFVWESNPATPLRKKQCVRNYD